MSESAAPSVLLDELRFKIRVSQELARVRRSGGFVSLAMFRLRPPPGTPGNAPSPTSPLAAAFRLQDAPGECGAGFGLLMPETSLDQAARGAERILSQVPAAGAAGVATVFGEVEGGAEALFAAAEAALAEAPSGAVARSKRLEGRPRVLVVDDDADFAQVLAETLSAHGFEGHPCTHAGDALARVASDSYCALFVDLVLRNASGLDLARRAIDLRPRRPVVLMSGHNPPAEAVLDALSLGPVLFVRKPIEARDLETALAMVRHVIPASRTPSGRRS
jgi:CheY-like chemotaxis protein